MTCVAAIAIGATWLLVVAYRRTEQCRDRPSASHGQRRSRHAAFDRGRLVAWNQAFIDLLGLPDSVMAVGCSADELARVEPRHGDRCCRPDRASGTRLSGKASDPDRASTRDGSILELSYRPHRTGGFVVSVTDVTRSRQAEEYLRQAHKMEALGQMTGGIAQ